tara:strand:+ start:467 stop:1315 length:849 start_codon:yes stop_codon:yes gene_type:complete
MRYIALILTFLITTSSFSEDKLSEFVSNLIPGEGITESSIKLDGDDLSEDPQINILAVRDINYTEFSNLFTQFGATSQKINNFSREILNLGFGLRNLNQDKSLMYGFNVFWDNDFEAQHNRASIGLELKGSMIDLTANSYHALNNQQEVNGVKEQVLSGYTFNLASQIPYSPWAKINWQNYTWDNEKSAENTEGNTLAIETYVTPSFQLIAKKDFSDNTGVDDTKSYRFVYVYPPIEVNSMLDGFSDSAFEKENMEKKLREKVRRENNLTVEIQGAVVVTSK